jgi:GNAT superfamily N-acetyltransferase
MTGLAALDNVMWHALAGTQARFAIGTDRARRYVPGYSPLVAFADPVRPDFEGLAPYCAPGERLYTDGWSGAVPPGWSIALESTMFKMVWDGGLPALDTSGVVRLDPAHAEQAFALAMLTRPGPFGPRTTELGDYFGCFDGGRLIAMAGERLQAGTLREISGVCTHPDSRGRGLASRLVHVLIHRELARGETPFLHVLRDNETARGLYRRMGFRDHRETVVRVIARSS